MNKVDKELIENIELNIFKNIKIPKRKTEKQLIIGMVGLVGSGKSTVARQIAKTIGAVIIESNAIRVVMRNAGLDYSNLPMVIDFLVNNILKKGGNIVVDSDCIDKKKRDNLKKDVTLKNVKVFYIRTFCDVDVAVGRIISNKNKSDFYDKAKSTWKGDKKYNKSLIKIREFWRRTPLHYVWVANGGGKWKLKKMPFIKIDTTLEKSWKEDLQKKLKNL